MKKNCINIIKDNIVVIFITVLIFVIIICLLLFVVKFNNNPLRVQDGVYTFDKDAETPQFLDGYWKFYWKQFINYNDKNKSFSYESVPCMWNHYNVEDESRINGEGYATFVVTINNVEIGQKYSLRLPTFGTSANVFINETILASIGKVAKTKEDYKPKYRVIYRDFIAQSTSFDIIIHVANYDYARGGLWLPILIARSDHMLSYRLMRNGYEYVVLGVMGIAVIIALILIIADKHSKSSCFFFLATLLVCIYHITAGDKLIVSWIPSISMRAIVRIQYVALFLTPPIFLQIQTRFYLSSSIRIITNYFVFHGILFSIFTLFAPVSIITNVTYYGNLQVFAVIIIALYILIKSIIVGNKEAFFLLISAMIMCVCVLHDFLYGAAIISSQLGELIVVGFVWVIFFMGFILISHVSKMKNQARMADVYEQAYLNAQIKPHFIFNTLNLLTTLVSKDAQKAEHIILNISVFLRNIIDRNNFQDLIPISKEVEIAKSYSEIEKLRFHNIDIIIDIDDTKDITLPPMTLQPLIENSIKHGLCPKKGGGYIKIDLVESSSQYIISVIDNGVGMSKNMLKQIREKCSKAYSTQTEIEEQTGGVGLVNVNSRFVRAYNNKIDIESSLDNGTAIRLVIDK